MAKAADLYPAAVIPAHQSFKGHRVQARPDAYEQTASVQDLQHVSPDCLNAASAAKASLRCLAYLVRALLCLWMSIPIFVMHSQAPREIFRLVMHPRAQLQRDQEVGKDGVLPSAVLSVTFVATMQVAMASSPATGLVQGNCM